MFEKLLETPTAQLGRASRFLVVQLKLWFHCFRLLRKNRSTQQAAALSYHTVFGLVPLAVLMLLVFQWFPAYSETGVKIKDLVYTQMHLSTIKFPDPANPDATVKLTDHLDEIVGRVFTGFNQGTMALFGVVLILWAALAVLSTIEGAFNNIWGVTRGRGFVQRIINYWALLTLGPLLLGVAVYTTTRYAAISEIQRTVLSHTAPVVLSYVVAVVGFFLLYFVLPNTHVEVKAAIWGAMVAAVVWTVAKWAFGLYVTKFIPYSQVYGVLGLIPLGVLWIYFSWLIVLFGLQLTFTTQHLKTLDAAEIAAATAKKKERYFIANEITMISIVRELAAGFAAGTGAVEAGVIANKLDISPEFVERILGHLVATGIVARVSEPKEGFLPAQDPAQMRLSEVAAAVAEAGFAQGTVMDSAGAGKLGEMLRDMLSKYTVKQLLEGDVGRDSQAVAVADSSETAL